MYGASGIGRRRLRRDDELALIVAAQAGDESASSTLVGRYRAFVRCKARPYFLAGADRDDIIQEGMIGLYKAIRDYRRERQASFRAFADICITRQLISAIKTSTRQKHSPLNGYVSLSRPINGEDEPERSLIEVLAAKGLSDPADIVISTWEMDSIREGFSALLSTLESEVLRLYLDGKSYVEIAGILGRHAKSVDNALQRVKRKMEMRVDRCRAC